MRASANTVLKATKANTADLADLARLIRRHAAETEKTVRDINQAESRLRPRIESAHALSRRVTEVHTAVQLSELHPWMALRPSQTGLTPGLVAVYYYADRGTMIDPSEVHKARVIVAAVPQIPQPGIPEWLKIEAQFIARGL
ncbi:hypothetical protein SAMN06309944_2092 [Micrococcales bacterium KH10]|nr:hypothetical protein SAMN06309944_2092 [Micrococcales bacterium KH10]